MTLTIPHVNLKALFLEDFCDQHLLKARIGMVQQGWDSLNASFAIVAPSILNSNIGQSITLASN